VFGSENFCGLIQFQKTSGAGSPAIGTDVIASVVDYVIWYAKDLPRVKYRQIYTWKSLGEEGTTQYVNARSTDQEVDRRLTREELGDPTTISTEWRVFASDNLTISLLVKQPFLSIKLKDSLSILARGAGKQT